MKLRDRDVTINEGRFNQRKSSNSQQNIAKKKEKQTSCHDMRKNPAESSKPDFHLPWSAISMTQIVFAQINGPERRRRAEVENIRIWS